MTSFKPSNCCIAFKSSSNDSSDVDISTRGVSISATSSKSLNFSDESSMSNLPKSTVSVSSNVIESTKSFNVMSGSTINSALVSNSFLSNLTTSTNSSAATISGSGLDLRLDLGSSSCGFNSSLASPNNESKSNPVPPKRLSNSSSDTIDVSIAAVNWFSNEVMDSDLTGRILPNFSEMGGKFGDELVSSSFLARAKT